MQVNLVLLRKDGTTSRFELPSTVTSIGRRQDCDFCIPLTVVSRRHCEINQDSGKITIRDLKSRNGTFVNGEPIEEALVKAGDVLRIGPVEFVVQVDETPANFEEYLQKGVEASTYPTAAEATAPEAAAKAAAPKPTVAEYTEEAMDDLREPELGGSQTELHSELSDDFDFDEDFNL